MSERSSDRRSVCVLQFKIQNIFHLMLTSILIYNIYFIISLWCVCCWLFVTLALFSGLKKYDGNFLCFIDHSKKSANVSTASELDTLFIWCIQPNFFKTYFNFNVYFACSARNFAQRKHLMTSFKIDGFQKKKNCKFNAFLSTDFFPHINNISLLF